MEVLEKAMGDAAHAGNDNAGNDGGSATTLDELIAETAESGVLEQAEAAESGLESEVDGLEPDAENEEQPEADAEESEEEEESLSEEEKAQLKQATQERITKKINKAHAKRKEAEERAEAAEQEREALAAKVAELEAGLEAVDVNAAAAASGVSDLFLVESEVALDQRAEEIQAGIDALDDWLDSNDRDETMVLKDGTEFGYAAVKARRRELKRMVDRDVPKARKLLERRATSTVEAKRLYPNLFKSTSAEHVQMQQMLRTVPGLRAHPDAKLLIGRMLAGKAIEGKTSAPAKPKPTAPKPPKTAAPAAKRMATANHNPEKVKETGSWDDLL